VAESVHALPAGNEEEVATSEATGSSSRKKYFMIAGCFSIMLVVAVVVATVLLTSSSPEDTSTELPTALPTYRPTERPTVAPTTLPTYKPTKRPTEVSPPTQEGVIRVDVPLNYLACVVPNLVPEPTEDDLAGLLAATNLFWDKSFVYFFPLYQGIEQFAYSSYGSGIPEERFNYIVYFNTTVLFNEDSLSLVSTTRRSPM
jgi:uncharacterized membrane protein YhaH (DUF805 family)